MSIQDIYHRIKRITFDINDALEAQRMIRRPVSQDEADPVAQLISRRDVLFLDLFAVQANPQVLIKKEEFNEGPCNRCDRLDHCYSKCNADIHNIGEPLDCKYCLSTSHVTKCCPAIHSLIA